jgi:hypothetical protein
MVPVVSMFVRIQRTWALWLSGAVCSLVYVFYASHFADVAGLWFRLLKSLAIPVLGVSPSLEQGSLLDRFGAANCAPRAFSETSKNLVPGQARPHSAAVGRAGPQLQRLRHHSLPSDPCNLLNVVPSTFFFPTA